MSPATAARPEDTATWIAAQIVTELERASRRQAQETLPGLPGAKRPDEEVLVLR